MDSLHTGSDELVYIQTDRVSVSIKGQAAHPDFQNKEISDRKANIKVVCDESFEIILKGEAAFGPLMETRFSCIGNFQVAPLFYEQQRYEIVIQAEEGQTVEFWHDNYSIRNKVGQVGHNTRILSGIINFGNEIGFSDLVIIIDGKRYLCLTIEVFPSKISYKEDYKELISDVTAEVYNIVFDFLKETYSSFRMSDKATSSPVEFFSVIRKIYGDFIRAADMILSRPHHQLQTLHEVIPSYKAKHVDNRSLRWIENHPEHTRIENDSILVSKILAVRKQVSYDTKENQLTKFMLQSISRRLQSFKAGYARLQRETDRSEIREIDSMISGINRRCDLGFMAQVDAKGMTSGMSLVFSMAPGYRDLYKYYLMLQHGLSISGDVFNISLKDLAVLYEYWCFIKLNSLMRNENYKLVSQDVVRVQGNGLYISLVKGQNSTVKYRNLKTGEIITLSYNPMKDRMPTVTQRPDNVLTLEKNGSDVKYEYVFDAKYRIDMALPGTTYNTYYSKPGPKEDDINTMHRYRDAIVSDNGVSNYERTMFGAYILFPLSKDILSENEYKDHHFYKSIDKVNIGGLPFLPSATSLVTEMLDELISDSPDSAFERATLPLGIEKKLAKVDWTRRDVLVGSLRNREQLDICLTHHFYHIPKRQLKTEHLPVRYVALYQSKNIFGSEACVQYYGEVISTRLLRRHDIREIPSSSTDEYYRLEIKEWKKLGRPIAIKEISGINFFTNLFLLEHSSETPELKIGSEAEYRLYSELKRILNNTEINTHDEGIGFTFGESQIVFDEGNIKLFRDGRPVGEYAIADFSKHPNAVFQRIREKV